MVFLRRYNTTLTNATAGSMRVRLPLRKAGSADFATSSDWTPAAGDVKVSKDAGAQANITTLPTYSNGSWEFTLSATELSARMVEVRVVDSATKAVDDEAFNVETFGNASAMWPQDYTLNRMGIVTESQTLTVDATGIGSANAVQVSGDAIAADRLEAMLDGTGGVTLSLKSIVVNNTDPVSTGVLIQGTTHGMRLVGTGMSGLKTEGYYATFFEGTEAGMRIRGTDIDGLLIEGNLGDGIAVFTGGNCAINAQGRVGLWLRSTGAGDPAFHAVAQGAGAKAIVLQDQGATSLGVRERLATLPTAGTVSVVGSAMTLTSGERDAVAAAVESHLLDEGDSQMLINAIVGAIGNMNVDEAALVAAIRADLERTGGNLNTVLSRLTAARASYLDKLNVSGVLANTDNAATFRADVSGLLTAAAFAASDTQTWAGRALGMVELSGGLYRYTVAALANAPSGGSSTPPDVSVEMGEIRGE